MFGEILEITADKLADSKAVVSFIEYSEAFGDLLVDAITNVVEDLPNTPERIIEVTTDTVEMVMENPEATAILCLAAVGVTFIIGRVVMRIPLPAVLEKKMVAPVIGVLTVRFIAKSAERRVENVDVQQSAA